MRVRHAGILGIVLVGGCDLEVKPTGDSATIPSTGETNTDTVEPTGTGDTATDGFVTDTFSQDPPSATDVLFVIDNSCSMTDNQSDLATNSPLFLDYFLGSGLDFHLGVVSTDMDNPSHMGKLRDAGGVRWVEDSTPNASQVFSQMIMLGSVGSGIEQGLGAAYAALEVERDQYNAGFLREDSAVHVIVLSDENDQTPNSAITQAEFIDWLSALRPEGSRTFSSIVTASGFDRGITYVEVSQAVGGSIYDIDTPDYAVVLEDLGLQSTGLSRTFCLTQVPDPATIEIRVFDPNGTELVFSIPSDATLTPENCVEFVSYVPEALSTIEIRYQPL